MSLIPKFLPTRFEAGYPGLGSARKAVSEVIKGKKKTNLKKGKNSLRKKRVRSNKFMR